MGWPCKLCSTVVPGKSDILKHYRLHHGTFGHSHALPCIHIDCPCSFKSWSSFRSHLSRYHPEAKSLNSPQVNEEFRRCTAVPLEATFMSQLDKHTPKLLELFSAKGGATGQRIKNLMMELIQDPSATAVKKRDVTLRCLFEYMGESGQELISDYFGAAETTVHEDLKMKNMIIYVCREPDAVGIIIEGIPVLTNLGNLAKACCLLLGLTYALNLEYPSKVSKTFEVFQRLFVGLDTLRPKPSPKFMTLEKQAPRLGTQT